jgi:pimeloyl-ACP methyl ester carboxylesterase
MVHALRHPEAVAGLVLVTPSSRGIADTSEDVARIRASRSGEPWYPEVAALLRELDSLPPHRRERLDRGLRPLFYGRWDDRARAHAASTDTQMSLRATAAFVPTDPATAPPAESLRGIDVETCVVVGELDAMTGTQAGHVIADWLPNASVATIPGAGHYPWIDDADRFRDVVSAFLASVAV